MSTESVTAVAIRAVRIHVTGRVQGLGVRPAVARLARQLGVTGVVANSADGLLVEIEGSAAIVNRFLDQFRASLPSGALVDRLQVVPVEPAFHDQFTIHERTRDGVGAAELPLDRVACDECLCEATRASDRRRDYPFISCPQCGPRYTIIEAMPYDRPATTMKSFPLCCECEAEYRSSDDRRFHAQTNACPSCGPKVWLVDSAGRQTATGSAALDLVANALRAGQIVALKGLGGYQLLVDATSTAAVERLRNRKQRPTKPLAVMVRNLVEATKIAHLTHDEQRQLTDPAGPIVLLQRRSDSVLSIAISPGLPSCGLMLPTTPLHALLMIRVGRPLVATSGNREGSALACCVPSAESDLVGIADWWLHHDRPIARPIDDSVVRVIDGSPCVIRLARGLAPLRLPDLPTKMPLIALGGEQKAAIAIGNGSQTVLGPHVGDLTSTNVCSRWQEQLDSLASLYGVSVSSAVVVHDAHPDYITTHWSERHASRPQAVYHHHAHVAAVMLEHRLEREVLGLAWDGTGYGSDGTIWGGEALRATRTRFQRVGTLRPFPLPGGERAIREPWRVAIALVAEALGPNVASSLTWPSVRSGEIDAVVQLVGRRRLMPFTSSIGRLFDAVAALTLGIDRTDDDARPAMLLEFAADHHVVGNYPLPWNRETGIADWRPLIVAVLHDLQRGTPPGGVAIRFHRALADWAFELSNAYPHLPLVVAGGVFQNRLLRVLLAERFADRSAGWYYPIAIPPGDGGLAAGQLAVVAARLSQTMRET